MIGLSVLGLLLAVSAVIYCIWEFTRINKELKELRKCYRPYEKRKY
jgi:hypothetical protein